MDALRADVAAVRLDDLLHNGESQARPGPGRIRRVSLENLRQHLQRDARPIVFDRPFDHTTNVPRANNNAAAGCILEGVAEQVLEDLIEKTRVRTDGQCARDFVNHLDLVLRGDRAEVEDQALNERPELKAPEFRTE